MSICTYLSVLNLGEAERAGAKPHTTEFYAFLSIL